MIKEVRVESILIDKLPYNRDVFNLALFIMYGGEIPPIHLQVSSEGGYKLRDGRHRVGAYKLLGLTTIKAKINENKSNQGKKINFTREKNLC